MARACSGVAEHRPAYADTRRRGWTLVGSLAVGPVSALSGGLAVALVVAALHYGYHGDELYFLAASQRPDWGYADQPPLVPLLARGTNAMFPGWRLGLRLPAIALTIAGVLVTALIARELGGLRWAQTLAAVTYAVSPRVIVTGELLVTQTLDAFLWSVVTLLLASWVRRRDDRLLVWLGLTTAVALQVKYLIVVFWLVCAASVLPTSSRELLRRPRLWVGGVLATGLTLPSVLWQARHGWPQLEMATVVPDEVGALAGGRIAFLPLTLLSAGIVVGAPLACYGLWQLLRSSALRDYRFLGLTCLGVLAVFVLAGGRYYYGAGLFPLCWAAAAVTLEWRRPARWWRWIPTSPACVLSAVLVITPVLSPQPLPGVASIDAVARASVGWSELADTVATAHRALPADARRDAVVLTDHYWQASALDRFGPQQGLPRSYSPHRGYWYFGPPPESSDTVLFVGTDPGRLRPYFQDVRKVAVSSTDNNGFPAVNERVSVWLCSGRDSPWSRIWPELRRP